MKNSKFSQVSTNKVIFEAKKIVSTTCQTRLNIFLLNPFWFTDKRKQNWRSCRWNEVAISFSSFLSCTQHVKNRKNRKPRKSALKFSIGIRKRARAWRTHLPDLPLRSALYLLKYFELASKTLWAYSGIYLRLIYGKENFSIFWTL